MTPGPDLILRIPVSGTLTRIATLNSSNNFGATYWTDGRCIAPMDPDDPPFRVHRPTGEFFWTEECEEVASETFSMDQNDSEWHDVPYADAPGVADCVDAITHGLGDTTKKERYLRVRLWWLQNDTVRDTGTLQADPTVYSENIRQLIGLSDLGQPNQLLMAADAARQLGDFDQCLRLLTMPAAAGYPHPVSIIRSLAEKRDPLVRQIHHDAEK
jgi:hypothetical protein